MSCKIMQKHSQNRIFNGVGQSAKDENRQQKWSYRKQLYCCVYVEQHIQEESHGKMIVFSIPCEIGCLYS